MFKQFTEHISGNQVYLLSSLGIFLVFFIVVAILLIKLKKHHAEYMSDIPLNDGISEPHNTIRS
ncbi:hypothetical protein ACFGVR_12650 [Mucilaginibacter sp. AW1-3]